MSHIDYYKELGLTKSASDAEIKKAFRKLAREYHPDTNPDTPGAEEKFKRISEAYDVLSDKKKKATYDQLSSRTSGYPSGGYSSAPGSNMSMDDVESMFSGTSFGDLLSEMFGAQQTQRSRATTRKQQPQRVFAVSLSLLDAFTGSSKRFTVDGKKVDITFKPGIATGQRLRLPDGDIEVTIDPHPRYVREGNNLRVKEHILLTTALLGGAHEIALLRGALSLNIPSGTTNGKVMRVKGQGMPDYTNEEARGDLYVEIVVAIPKTLTPEQAQAVEELRKLGL